MTLIRLTYCCWRNKSSQSEVIGKPDMEMLQNKCISCLTHQLENLNKTSVKSQVTVTYTSSERTCVLWTHRINGRGADLQYADDDNIKNNNTVHTHERIGWASIDVGTRVAMFRVAQTPNRSLHNYPAQLCLSLTDGRGAPLPKVHMHTLNSTPTSPKGDTTVFWKTSEKWYEKYGIGYNDRSSTKFETHWSLDSGCFILV